MKVLPIFFLVFVLSIFVNAQKAVLSGTITDDQGALIPNGKMQLDVTLICAAEYKKERSHRNSIN